MVFCEQINPQNKLFDKKSFLKEFKDRYEDLELKERLNLIAILLDKFLPGQYETKVSVLRTLLGEKLPYEEGMFTHCYHLYPVSQFVEKYGHQDLDSSLRFIEDLTMRFTGEWAIRPLANKFPDKVLRQMKAWAKHENFHVRRLASEGLRAKLPWGMKIDWITSDPSVSLPVYNKLRNDKVLYVRRSVANSMGDIIKINERLALETFEGWLGKKLTKDNLWVIKHAIRSPVKKDIKKFVLLKKKIERLLKEVP